VVGACRAERSSERRLTRRSARSPGTPRAPRAPAPQDASAAPQDAAPRAPAQPAPYACSTLLLPGAGPRLRTRAAPAQRAGRDLVAVVLDVLYQPLVRPAAPRRAYKLRADRQGRCHFRAKVTSGPAAPAPPAVPGDGLLSKGLGRRSWCAGGSRVRGRVAGAGGSAPRGVVDPEVVEVVARVRLTGRAGGVALRARGRVLDRNFLSPPLQRLTSKRGGGSGCYLKLRLDRLQLPLPLRTPRRAAVTRRTDGPAPACKPAPRQARLGV